MLDPMSHQDLKLPPTPREAELMAETERLRDGLDAIRQYGSDTLRGPSDQADDTREWQRDGVLELTNRAVRVLSGRPWFDSEPKERSGG